MKKSEITTGKTYTDKKGNVRRVIAEGVDYILYPGQKETDNLCYRLIAKARGPGIIGWEYNSTRASFAAWAKAEIKQAQEGRT
jgi:hypothetical protein